MFFNSVTCNLWLLARFSRKKLNLSSELGSQALSPHVNYRCFFSVLVSDKLRFLILYEELEVLGVSSDVQISELDLLALSSAEMFKLFPRP